MRPGRLENLTPYTEMKAVLEKAGATDFQRHDSGYGCVHRGRHLGISIFPARNPNVDSALYVFVHTPVFAGKAIEWHDENPLKRLEQVLEIL